MGTPTAMMAQMRKRLVPCRTVRKATSSVTRPAAATPSPGSVTETRTVGLTDPTKVPKSVVSDWILRHWIFISFVQSLLISNSIILNLCIIYIKFPKLGKVGAFIIQFYFLLIFFLKKTVLFIFFYNINSMDDSSTFILFYQTRNVKTAPSGSVQVDSASPRSGAVTLTKTAMMDPTKKIVKQVNAYTCIQ